MKNVLILGANGGLARAVIPYLIEHTDAHLTLFLRRADRLANLAGERVKIVDGDVLNSADLQAAMDGVDIVYANLAGNLEAMAKNIVQAMRASGMKRLIFISSMGIYGETGEDHGAILEPYRRSALVVENSGLDYTVIRPAWFTNTPEIDYRLTHKGEAFQGSQVSKKSIADLIAKLVNQPDWGIGESLGIGK